MHSGLPGNTGLWPKNGEACFICCAEYNSYKGFQNCVSVSALADCGKMSLLRSRNKLPRMAPKRHAETRLIEAEGQ
jgi:hypothetical protein